MPKAIDPNATYDVVLESDMAIDADVRPTFTCHFLTGREQLALAAAADALNRGEGGQVAAIEKCFEAIAVGLVGWRNMNTRAGDPIEFERSALPDVVDISEAIELMTAQIDAVGLSAEKKDRSESPP